MQIKHVRLNDSQKILRIICCLILTVILLIIFACILLNANWIFGDDHQIIQTTALNKACLFGHNGGGRYWPLGLWDYNLLVFIPFGCTPLGHYIYNSVIFFLTFICMSCLLKEIIHENTKSLLFITFVFLTLFVTRNFIYIYMSVIFAERMMLFLLSVFMLSYLKGRETQQNRYYAIALLSAFYLTYCKEPVFGVWLVIAVTDLLFGYKQRPKKELIFNYIQIGNSIIYFIHWFFFEFLPAKAFYNVVFRFPDSRGKLALTIFDSYPILWLVLLLFIIRAVQVIIVHDKKHLYFDSLLFGAVSYTAAFIFLKLWRSYYSLISVWLSIPSLVYWADFLIKKNKSKIAAFLMASTFLAQASVVEIIIKNIQMVHNSRKNDMKIIETIANWEKSGKTTVFLGKNIWYYTIWNSFLRYYNKNEELIKKINNLNEISDNDVVICQPNEETKNLKKRGFSIVINSPFGNVLKI